MNIYAAITEATCGEACWEAKQDICRCSCAGANHGITRFGGIPERTSKIDGIMYKLIAVGGCKNIEKQALDSLAGQVRRKEYRYTYYWSARDKGSPLRVKPASKSQIDRWHELAHYKANPVPAYDWHNAPYMLWERIKK